jgi:hypothetical protein
VNVLARYRNPVPIWTQGDIANWQRRPDQYLFEFAIFKRESAHCAVFGSGNEEAILHFQSAFRPELDLLLVHTPATTAVLFS